jgi:transposase
VSDAQLRLAFAQLAEELKPRDEPTEMDTGERPGKQHRRPPRPTGRRPLPASLRRQRIEIDVPEADKVCACGTAKTRIGETVTEKLDYVPASVRVMETVRPKYACPQCHEGVTVAPAPPQAVERSLASEGLLAHVVVSKYLDHLPLYRLERIFQREHLDLSRATLCGWVADVATALAPIGEELRRQVTAASYLQTDDTPVTILEDTGSRKGRIWTYLDPLAPQVVFDATRTHERAPSPMSPSRSAGTAGVEYVVAMAKNAVLDAAAEPHLQPLRAQATTTHETATSYHDSRYQAKTWPHARRAS